MSVRAAVCALAASTALATSASAQAPPLQFLFGFALCRNIKADADRLKCFDSLAVPQQQQLSDDKDKNPPAISTWQVQESRAPLDDSPQITGLLHAIEGDLVLMLRCHERETELALVGEHSLFGIGRDPLTVTIRINGDQPITAKWASATSGQAAFAPDAIKFIRALPDDGQLFARVASITGRTFDARFKLSGVSPVRDKVAVACNWNAPAKTPTPPPKR